MINLFQDTADEGCVVLRIKRAFLTALSLVAIVTLLAYCVGLAKMEQFEQSTSLKNAMVEQRTLSQLITILATDFVYARYDMPRQIAAQALTKAKSEFVSNHRSLEKRVAELDQAGYLSPQARRIFYKKPYDLDMKLNKFVDSIDTLLKKNDKFNRARYNTLYSEAIISLGTTLDEAVERLEEASQKKIVELSRLQLGMMVVVMLILLGEWQYIFRPLIKVVENRTRDLREARDEAAHAAMHDPLTDLPNRRFLEQRLHEMLRQTSSQGRPLIVCHLDLDHFKEINDTLGHPVGDMVLRHAVSVMRDTTRNGVFIARFGGDEFVIVDDTVDNETDMIVAANLIIERMAQPFVVNGHTCRIGASIGIAACAPDDLDTAGLLCHADIALYYSKELGRGQVQVYSSIAQDAFDTRRSLKAA